MIYSNISPDKDLHAIYPSGLISDGIIAACERSRARRCADPDRAPAAISGLNHLRTA
jgi:hypothetical protein